MIIRRILVSGAGGFVGARMMQQYAGRFELSAFPRGMLSAAGEKDVRAFVMAARPDVIVHTAAISDTGYSERHPDESLRANVLLPEWMARAAKNAGAKLLCLSSDQVYAGCLGPGPFDENTDVRPGNVYGRHKLESETRVLRVLPDAVMLRATWMYDLPGYCLPTHSNLLTKLLFAAAKNEQTCYSALERRGITYVRQAVSLLEPAFSLPGGVYNFGSENPLNMLETARDFYCALGLEARADALLAPDETRPSRSLAISCEKLDRFGIHFDSAQEGIRRCVKDYHLA